MGPRICLLLFLGLLSMSTAAPFLVRLRRSVDLDGETSEHQQQEDTKEAPTRGREGKALNAYESEGEGLKEQVDQPNKGYQHRQNKALAYFDYLPQFFPTDDDYGDDELIIQSQAEDDGEDLSRTIPSNNRRKQQQNPYKDFTNTNSLNYDNSPIYYIRLPPTPYMFVPGLGYVSQPPNIGAPVPQVNPFINLPIDFVSNGKPTNVYQWNGAPAYQPQPINPFGPIFAAPQRPPPPPPPQRPVRPQSSYSSYRPQKKPVDTKITGLNKGPYVFNGKPSDIFVLRDSYNSLYSDALQNFYP